MEARFIYGPSSASRIFALHFTIFSIELVLERIEVFLLLK